MKIEKKEAVPVPPPPCEYVLTLSHEQAMHLTSIVCNIGAEDGDYGELAAEWKTLCELNNALKSVGLDKHCNPYRMRSMKMEMETR